MHLLVVVALLAFVVWRGRHIPLAGWKRLLAMGCHLAALLLLCAALWGPPRTSRHDVPRQIVYLVDHSASIDAGQQAWIARRIASLEARRPGNVSRAVVAFGNDAKGVVPFARDPLANPDSLRRTLDASGIDRARTNLETALLVSASMLPPRQQGGVILFSDGRETAGSAAGIASHLRRLGVEVYPEPPPVCSAVKTVWDSLSIPPVVQRGSSVPVKLVVFNAAATVKSAEVSVAVQGVSVKRQRVVLRQGWQVVTVPVRALGRGTMALDVQLTIAGDRLAERRAAYTEVEGPPQVLFVGERIASLPVLAQALKRRGMDLAVMRPSELPVEAERLQDYDAVLCFHPPKSAFSAAQVQALRSYLETSGGGLVTVGLGGNLAEELKQPAPLDDLLPVTFEPKGVQEAKRLVCFILLIDRSASMLGPRIAATKRAAVELVKQLAPEDLVGVLAFDTQAYVVAEMQPAGQIGSWLVEKLVKLHSTGGTDVFPALTAAADRFERSGAKVKHIILLSDGNTPFQEPAYNALVDAFRKDGTTVSTIGIGPAFVNVEYLRWLAGSTGGSYYLMRSPDELPRLVLQDTQRELGRLPFVEGFFRPSKPATTDWFADITEWPTLRGFLTATAKPGAAVDLTIDGGSGEEPLLARWSLGRGRVVSFTSDADTRWSPDWVRWPGFESAWGQVVRWAFRPRLAEELFVWMDEHRGVPQLMIEGTLDAPKAELISPSGTQHVPLSLMQTGTWRWQAALEQVPSGWYQLALESRLPAPPAGVAQAGQGDTPVFAKRWIQVGTPPQGPELAGQPPQETVLRQIAEASGGVYAAADRAFVPPTTTATTARPLFTWWLPLVILLLLIEVALRGSSML